MPVALGIFCQLLRDAVATESSNQSGREVLHAAIWKSGLTMAKNLLIGPGTHFRHGCWVRVLRIIQANFTQFAAVFVSLLIAGQVQATTALVNNATFVSQNVPATMTAGQSYTVTVTMKNNGTSTWVTAATNSGSYRLGSQNPQDNTTWGTNRIPLSPSILPATSLAPGQTLMFSFPVTAPTSPGTYNFQWRMVQDGVAWFGDTTPNQSIVVTAVPMPPTVTMTAPVNGATAYNGAFVQAAGSATASGGATITKFEVLDGTTILSSVPNASSYKGALSLANGSHSISMRATDSLGYVGQSATANITVGPPPIPSQSAALALTNCTSFSPMAAPTPASMTCTLSNTASSSTNSISYSVIAGVSVTGPTGPCAAGATCGTVVVATSTTPGTYTGTLTASPPAGYSASVNVNLTETAMQVNGATFVSQSLPSPLPLVAGQPYSVKVVMKNSGTTTWTTDAKYRLGATGPNDNTVWDSSTRIALPLDPSTGQPEAVPPGGVASFAFSVTAPATAGTYNYQWQIVQDGVAWFGDATPAASLVVVKQDPSVAWQGLMSAFGSGNVATVETFFLDPTKYDAVLQAMSAAQMASIPGTMSTIQFVEVGPDFATAVVDQTSNGTTLRHYVSFLLVDDTWYVVDF